MRSLRLSLGLRLPPPCGKPPAFRGKRRFFGYAARGVASRYSQGRVGKPEAFLQGGGATARLKAINPIEAANLLFKRKLFASSRTVLQGRDVRYLGPSIANKVRHYQLQLATVGLLVALSCLHALSILRTPSGDGPRRVGAPIAGVTVIVTNQVTRKWKRSRSGPDGRYSLQLPAGISDEGWATERGALRQRQEHATSRS